MVSKHDKLLKIIDRDIRRDFDFTRRNVEMQNYKKTRTLLEVDLQGWRPNFLWLLEFKCHDNDRNFLKAYHQLRRIEKCYVPNYDYPVRDYKLFYGHGFKDNNRDYKLIEIPKINDTR